MRHASSRRWIRAQTGRLTTKISVAAVTVLASLAVAAPASAWPVCGW